ncbi:MAG: PxKF domain-containing protein [Patescibacteria group bacterium]
MKCSKPSGFSILYVLFFACAFVLFLAPYPLLAATTVSIPLLESAHGATFERGPVSTWTSLREGSTGILVGNNLLEAVVSAHNTITGYQAIKRGFVSFDTSSIPQGAVIESAALVLTPKVVSDQYPSSSSYVGVYEGVGFVLNPSHTTQDYGHCGTLNDPLELAPSAPLNQLQPETPFAFSLNANGVGAIRKEGITKFCLREGHDVENQPVVEPVAVPWKSTGASFYITSATSTEFQPHLEVQYSYEPSVIPTVPTGDGLVHISIPVVSASDVWVSHGNGIVLDTWQNIRSALSGYKVSTTSVMRTAVNILDSLRPNFNKYLGFDRSFLSFDVVSIPDDVEVVDARLKVHVAEVYKDYLSADATLNLYSSFQYAAIATTSAYSRCGGTLTNPTPLATSKHVGALHVGDEVEFYIENTGALSQALSSDRMSFCFRIGYDANDVPIQDFVPAWRSVGVGIISSSSNTPTLAPTLEVTYKPKKEECCSSVVFLPGIKGSNLRIGYDSVWPPNLVTFSDDIAKLALTESGESVNPVVVDGVLNYFHVAPIYAGFTNFLEELEIQGTIQDWLPVPYDWRYGPEDILADGVQTPAGVFDIIEEIEKLAEERSQTGQVTIVAHSMGGLLGKAIIKELERREEADLVDSFVMVGSPQLGTPQAIAGILHGDDEGIGLGSLYYVVNPASSRMVSQNFQSVYNLLPSRAYFDATDDPVIVFDENADFTEPWRNFWGSGGIGEYLDFFGFATGAGVLRENPDVNELRIPEIIRGDLLQNADDFHTEYDNYIFPPNIRVVQVAGWGLKTTKGVEYKNNHFLPGYKTIKTREGDKSVVYPSALLGIGEEFFFNVFDYNESLSADISHRDLLSAGSVKDLIQKVVQKNDINNNIPFVSVTKSEISELEDQLVISTHSPVILGVYDANGNFTGIDQNQDLSQQALLVAEEIPGSSFITSSDSQSIFLPKEGSYTFVYRGTGEGPTTVEVGIFSGDQETVLQSYNDLPTSLDTRVTFEVESTNPENTELFLDKNADGLVDFTIAPSETGETAFVKAPLAIRALSERVILGESLPSLQYEISGFVANETRETSDIVGEPECSTLATTNSLAGVYPVVCTQGTLASDYYSFENFVAGELVIEYVWSGFLQPIDDLAFQPGATPSIFKAGSTVPVKFVLKNVSGEPVEAQIAPQWLQPTKGTVLVGSVDEPVSYDTTTLGTIFRYDQENNQYVYNWKTKGLAAGYWYYVVVKLDDGTIRTVKVGLK